MHPETLPAALPTETTPSKWPTVWGVLCLLYAGLTALTSCCGSLGVFLGPKFAAMGGMDMPPSPSIMSIMMIADNVISVFLVLALVMGGIGLLRRRPTARKILLVYVTVRILLAPVQMVSSIAMEKPGAEWGRQIASAQVDAMEKAGQKAPPELVAAANDTKVSSLARYQSIGLPVLFVIFPALLALVLTKKRPEMETWTA
jgi:hypothetical protein